MNSLRFNKTELVNLKYSLNKEIVRTNRASSYSSTTLTGCNTRKYHGLLVSPLKNLGDGKYVLLSTLDETIIQHGEEFNLGLHQYEGNNYFPRGHKYLRDFSIDIIPVSIYRVGGVILRVEKLLTQNEERVLLKYTLEDAHSETWLRLKPFLAFRDMHSLCKANMDINKQFRTTENGIIVNLYDGYPDLYMQISKKADFVPVPDWYYNIAYKEEQRRGYEYKEDLYVPGYFEMKIKKGETIIFSAGLTQTKPNTLKRKFTFELNKRTPRSDFYNCLINAAQQFVHKTPQGNIYIVAGYPWLRSRHRDSFISLPGLMIPLNDGETYKTAINTILKNICDNGLISETRRDRDVTADTSLWFFWALQKYSEHFKKINVWNTYGKVMKNILKAYKNATIPSIQLHENGLIYTKETGKALTWMNAYSYDGPVTPRYGYAVEVNALWYNALSFVLALAKANNDKSFIQEWNLIADTAKTAFIENFWDKEKCYLADFYDPNYKNWDVRPNQVIAAAMPYTPLTKEMIAGIVKKAEQELLTPKGLRTLSPNSIHYKNKYEGDHYEREETYHQGTVWPFLIQFFIEAALKCFGQSFLHKTKNIYQTFEEEMTSYGLGTIGEVFNGDPPFKPKGAISVAKSVAALLYIKLKIDSYK